MVELTKRSSFSFNNTKSTQDTTTNSFNNNKSKPDSTTKQLDDSNQNEPPVDKSIFQKEFNHLHSILETWLEDNIKGIELDYEVLPIKVARDPFGVLSCCIGCPVVACNTISRGSKKGTRWSHNFYKHMKSHLAKRKHESSEGTLCNLLFKKKKKDDDIIDVSESDKDSSEECNNTSDKCQEIKIDNIAGQDDKNGDHSEEAKDNEENGNSNHQSFQDRRD